MFTCVVVTVRCAWVVCPLEPIPKRVNDVVDPIGPVEMVLVLSTDVFEKIPFELERVSEVQLSELHERFVEVHCCTRLLLLLLLKYEMVQGPMAEAFEGE